jgi:hypothetical protein
VKVSRKTRITFETHADFSLDEHGFEESELLEDLMNIFSSSSFASRFKDSNC